jgi:predicted nucleic acid-binding protein
VDSSIFIAAERQRFDWSGFHGTIHAESLYLAVVTLAELLQGAERADSPERKARRLAFVRGIEARYPLLVFGREEAAEYANIWAALHTSGMVIGSHDLQIAAIARHHGHGVATLNAREFTRVPGLSVLDASPYRTERSPRK